MMKMRKRELATLTVIAVSLALIFIGCGGSSGGGTKVPVTGVTLNKTVLNLDLTTNTTETLVATVAPANASNKKVTWTSSDTAKATVNATGVVNVVAVGTATITVKTDDGNFTAECTVTITEDVVEITGVTLKSSTSINIGANETLVATVQPATAPQTVTWTSSDTAKATVTAAGVVTGVAEGTANITATSTVDTSQFATCVVTVTKIAVNSVAISPPDDFSLFKGEFKSLTTTVLPPEATYPAVTWSTSNAAVATVSGGLVTALTVGNATITATADGKTATVTVTVLPVPVTGVALNTTSTRLLVGGPTFTLIATVAPNDAENKTVTWESNAPTVATVANGVVTAVAAGTATITVKTTDGNKEATCVVYVDPPLTSGEGAVVITLSKTDKGLDMDVDVDGSTIISRGAAESVTYEIDDAGTYAISWLVDGNAVSDTDTLTIEAVKYGLGSHGVVLTITDDDDITWSKSLPGFTVTQ